jgi:phage FluMu protein Com
MSFTVRCPHCETLLKVPDKYHYQVIPCPSCKNEIEAISTETLEVGEKFLQELEDMESDMIIDESRPAGHRLKKPDQTKPATPETQEPDDDIPKLKNT